jgi:hypothetical protein
MKICSVNIEHIQIFKYEDMFTEYRYIAIQR